MELDAGCSAIKRSRTSGRQGETMKNSKLVYEIRDVRDFRELFFGSAERVPENTAFLRRVGKEAEEITYRRAAEDISALASFFSAEKLDGAKIAVIGKNCYEWAITYLAVTCGIGVIVPFDRELKEGEISFLAEESEILAIVADDAQLPKLAGLTIPIYPFSRFAEYLERGESLRREGDRTLENHRIDPYTLSVLIYTSGTTGVAKGVMLSQYNICSNITGVLRRTYLGEEDRCLSVLPLHHTYEACAGFLAFLYAGASIAYCTSLKHLMQEFVLFRPTVFVTVPLILETFLSSVEKKYANRKGGKLLLSVQRAASSLTAKDEGKKKIFAEVNAAFGGRLRAFLCGAAALPPAVARGLESFGFPCYVGYGLTETSPVCIMHNDFYRSPDSVGYPISGVSVRLIEQNEDGTGELAVKGPNVMLGYYKKPEETAAVLQDGWFRTGDMAHRNRDGSYSIVGRTKSMIVTQNGKKIFPEEIEYHLTQDPLVSDALVWGEEENGDITVVASVYPDYPALEERLAKEGILPETPEYDNAIAEWSKKLMKDVNAKLPYFKALKRIKIRREEFLKTGTRKIKRFAPENRE